MRILLTATASYAPPRGGATRANLIWINHLAAAGHECRILCGESAPGAELRQHPSVAILTEGDPSRRVRTLGREIAGFAPDWVLVSSEDLGHGLLQEAHRRAPGRIVYLAHTPQFFPFGPASWNKDARAAELVKRSAGIVTIGQHMAAYVQRCLGRSAATIHPPIYGSGPFPNFGNFASGLITMINPCAVKGISIFLKLAERMAGREFAVVPGWGTTTEDGRALDRLPNVRVLPNAPSIDDVLRHTRILLMPSLWYEGFGLIVMEAMLRGIPVVSSDSGGIKEAKQGTGYVIPVETIEHYQPVFDENAMPKPVVPDNVVAPWQLAVEKLLTVREAYESESMASRCAAERFVAGLDAADMERFLLGLAPTGPVPLASNAASTESLSPERRALLLQRLHQRRVT